ncbi:xanthine dehydrogenase YagS FAD-binding subunit [Chryseobacterium taichungense]|uniref:Xanthine dehydrogenase YagS FAD-binding subunit n=1 Tax=Chryseobacterium taichungense TaxID=295069 RepID=A0A1H7X3Y8_9FLAO|nr:xanthine dehydrogenase family protein subunit M [Chryseobacterium taichungense]SEM28566.1 xanthine dehydrogenase YagS FAD-binding subunit [Chryseobacterium taichungense]
MRPFNFEKVKSTAEASSMKSAVGQYIAGGTNLVDLMKKNITQPETLIDVTIALSNTVNHQNNILQIGAMASNSKIANNKDVVEKFPLISKAILAGASPQIRNMASSAGNLMQRTRCPYFYDITTPCNKRKPNSGCSALHGANRMSAVAGYNDQCVAVHPSDFCVALAALDATVIAQTKDQKEVKIPFKDFHKLPENTPWLDNNLPQDAVITSIEIPDNAFEKHSAYVKVRDRTSYAFALVSVAAALDLDGKTIKNARLASGGVAHKPWRWFEVEKFLNGKRATTDVFEAAARLATKDLKPLSENGYKIPMLQGAMVTALQSCVNQ